MTVSGMQTFAGEDLRYEKRRKLQQEQIRFGKKPKQSTLNDLSTLVLL